MVTYMCIVSLVVLTFEVLLVSVFGKDSNSTISDNCTDFHCGPIEVFQKLFPIPVRRDGCTEGSENPENDLSLFCSPHQELILMVYGMNYTVQNINFTTGTMVIDLGDTFDQCITPFDWIDAFQPSFFPINTVVLYCNSSLSRDCSPVDKANPCGRNASSCLAAELFGENDASCCYLQSPKNFTPIDYNTSEYNSCMIYGSQGSLLNSSNTEGDIDLTTFPLKWQPGSNFLFSPPTNDNRVLIWTLSTTLPFFMIVGGIIFTITFWKYHANMMILREIQQEFANKEVQPTLYSYNILKTATRDFHQSNKLGEGGFGIVYKGVLSNGRELAIKLLKKSEQGVTEFLNEIVLLTSVKHKNLVTLKGCCLHGVQRFLVYEFVENQNLAEVLWGDNHLQLDWPRRFNICVGIARGLSYLHEDSHQRIIHRDIKAPNILLDKQFNAKIADFGLARLFPDDESHMTTFHIAGTRGYLAPEYATLGQFSDKVDVYSFGVLLLEIISGRKNIDFTLSIDKIYLLEWAWFLHDNKMLQNLIDQNLNINNNLESQIQHVINVALLCVHTTPTRRPSMMHVLAMLLGEKEVEVAFRESLDSKKNYSFMSKSSNQSSNANLAICNTNCSSELPNGNNGLVELETCWILDHT